MEEWEKKIRRRLNALVTHLGEPLAKERGESEQQWVRKKWPGLGNNYTAPKDLSSIFTPTELLEHMVGISSPNSVRNGDTADGMNRGLVKIRLTQKSIVELRATYSVLGDATLHVETVLRGNGEAAYNEKVSRVLEQGMSGVGREACKRGCPTARRRELWSLALGVDTSRETHAFHFEKLKSSVLSTHLFLEKLLDKEMKETTANDVNYFVFEDTILQVLFAFLHDYTILDQLQHINMTPMKAYIPGVYVLVPHNIHGVSIIHLHC
jgi:hypothetical protein